MQAETNELLTKISQKLSTVVDELKVITKQFERIDPIEGAVENKSPIAFTGREKLTAAFIHAIMHELTESGALVESTLSRVRNTLEKFVPRYFAIHDDTDKKLRQAWGELHEVRQKMHETHMEALLQAKALIAMHLATPNLEKNPYQAANDLREAINTLINLNKPYSEVIDHEHSQQST